MSNTEREMAEAGDQKAEKNTQDPRLEQYSAAYLDRMGQTIQNTGHVDSKFSASLINNLTELAMDFARERIRHEDELKALAEHDSLTELLNHRGFIARFNEKLEVFGSMRYQLEHPEAPRRSRETPNLTTPGPFIFLDLVDFKLVNDLRGHLFGDEVLKAVAKALNNSLRPNDLAARVGGDEFVVFLEGESLEGGLQAANRLMEAINSTSRTDLDGFEQGVSIGVAMLPGNLTSEQLSNTYFRSELFDRAYQQADEAAYHVKGQTDKNGVAYKLPSGEFKIHQAS